MEIETETIDKLFLELSQVTTAATATELNLAMLVRRLSQKIEELSPGDALVAKSLAYLRHKNLLRYSLLRSLDDLPQ